MNRPPINLFFIIFPHRLRLGVGYKRVKKEIKKRSRLLLTCFFIIFPHLRLRHGVGYKKSEERDKKREKLAAIFTFALRNY